jgi:3-hydroxyacyl-CoA dehydrogenase
MNVLYSETGDSKYRPALLLKKMVRGNHLGVKTNIGFYKYADGNKTAIDAIEETVVPSAAVKQA